MPSDVWHCFILFNWLGKLLRYIAVSGRSHGGDGIADGRSRRQCVPDLCAKRIAAAAASFHPNQAHYYRLDTLQNYFHVSTYVYVRESSLKTGDTLFDMVV